MSYSKTLGQTEQSIPESPEQIGQEQSTPDTQTAIQPVEKNSNIGTWIIVAIGIYLLYTIIKDRGATGYEDRYYSSLQRRKRRRRNTRRRRIRRR